MARKKSMDQADLPEDEGIEPVDDQREHLEAVDDSRTDSLWVGERSDGERIAGERLADERSIDGEELWDDLPEEVDAGMLADESSAETTVLSLEALEEELGEQRAADEANDLRATKYTDGSTSNPEEAVEQGLVYNPPTDPPVVPSDNSQGIEMGVGFGSSMEETPIDVEDLPDDVAEGDLNVEANVYAALRFNSETGHLTDIQVRVEDGIVSLFGTVDTEDDLGFVEDVVYEVKGVEDVRSHLEVRTGSGAPNEQAASE
jgi:hypothetical protein